MTQLTVSRAAKEALLAVDLATRNRERAERALDRLATEVFEAEKSGANGEVSPIANLFFLDRARTAIGAVAKSGRSKKILVKRLEVWAGFPRLVRHSQGGVVELTRPPLEKVLTALENFESARGESRKFDRGQAVSLLLAEVGQSGVNRANFNKVPERKIDRANWIYMAMAPMDLLRRLSDVGIASYSGPATELGDRGRDFEARCHAAQEAAGIVMTIDLRAGAEQAASR